MTQESITVIRNRRVGAPPSNKNKQAEAKALLQIASMLDADADQLEAAVQHERARVIGHE